MVFKNCSLKRLPNLDSLRFLLATFVLIFHIPQLCKNQGLPYFDALPMFHRGTQAVYMFFSLSGFLIIRLIYIAKMNGSFSVRNFYMRRVLRIFPLYYLIATFGFVFYQVLLPYLNIPFENNYALFEGILLSVFFFPNIFSTLYEPGGILEILWSIGIEEQFYLFIAPLLYVLHKRKVLMVLSGLLIGYFVIYHLEYFWFLKKFSFVYFFIFSGGVVAILEEERMLEFLKKSIFTPLIVCILTVMYFMTDIFVFETRWLNNLLTSVLFGLFIHTLSFNNQKIEITNKWTNYFGKISYGIYMYSAIAMNIVVFMFLKFPFISSLGYTLTIFLINAFTFILTIIFAHISYNYFEKYFLKKKIRFRQ
ncbi:MAG: peptidoglycan/LPS O-acetylase OafA/YrhL [Ulvibacter sp.]